MARFYLSHDFVKYKRQHHREKLCVGTYRTVVNRERVELKQAWVYFLWERELWEQNGFAGAKVYAYRNVPSRAKMHFIADFLSWIRYIGLEIINDNF